MPSHHHAIIQPHASPGTMPACSRAQKKLCWCLLVVHPWLPPSCGSNNCCLQDSSSILSSEFYSFYNWEGEKFRLIIVVGTTTFSLVSKQKKIRFTLDQKNILFFQAWTCVSPCFGGMVLYHNWKLSFSDLFLLMGQIEIQTCSDCWRTSVTDNEHAR